MKILILGSTGMLGSMVLKYLSTKKLDITAPSREEMIGVDIGDYDYIINCVGIIKQKLTDTREAIEINSLLPHDLSKVAPKTKIIQIATDCVYSGKKGNYDEDDEHDASNIYGKTKSLGEVEDKNFYNIRTSIIGPGGKGSLLEWFLSQKKNATIKGYTNHYWNGITTLHFAKLCYMIISGERIVPNHFHFIPEDIVSKYELLKIFAEKFNRNDINIERFREYIPCNRSLDSIYIETVRGLWKDMGYKEMPTIKEMVNEL